MTKKLAGYYQELPETGADQSRLVLEISPCEIACVHTAGGTVYGLELFSVDGEDHENTFAELLSASNILNRSYQETTCYYLSEEVLVIPAQKFDPATAEDYLALVFGERYHHDVKHDVLTKKEQVTAYHIHRAMHDAIGRQYVLYQPRHVYTGILNCLLTREQLPPHLVHLQVYQGVFVLSLMKDGQLQLIRSFHYKTAEDILYYLTSVLQQFPVLKNHTHLEIAGRMEEGFLDTVQLGKLFGEISYQSFPSGRGSLPPAISEYPDYYFTPLLNLAL